MTHIIILHNFAWNLIYNSNSMKRKMGIIITIAGLIITFAGIATFAFGSKEKAGITQTQPSSEKQNAANGRETTKASAKEKGNDFEAFFADVLKQNGIHIKTWNQGSVSPGGAIADNALDPDFFVEQKAGNMALEYWIECKWRADVEGSFSLPQKQFDRYRDKQRTSKRKVILFIGVGGEPSAPAATYAVPLDSIVNGSISRQNMKQFYMSDPVSQFGPRVKNWFFNEVFKNNKK